MADIIIRNLDGAAAKKLTELAKKKKMSREEYIRRYLTTLSVINEVKEIEGKYNTLVQNLADVIKVNTETMARVNFLLDQKL